MKIPSDFDGLKPPKTAPSREGDLDPHLTAGEERRVGSEWVLDGWRCGTDEEEKEGHRHPQSLAVRSPPAVVPSMQTTLHV